MTRRSQKHMSVSTDAVEDHSGRLAVTCDCGEVNFLGKWGAAHLGHTTIETQCQCGILITIERDDASVI